MAATVCLPTGGSTTQLSRPSSTPRPISRSRSRADGQESSFLSNSILSQNLELKRSPTRNSLPADFGSLETTRRRSFKGPTNTASHPSGSIVGFDSPLLFGSPGSRDHGRRLDGLVSSGLLSQQFRATPRHSDGQTPEAVLKVRTLLSRHDSCCLVACM